MQRMAEDCTEKKILWINNFLGVLIVPENILLRKRIKVMIT